MSKFPEPPGVAALRDITPQTLVLSADTKLARIYFAAGPHPSHWNQVRSFGPTAARWDHHLPNAHGAGVEQERAVYYCAPDVDTCAAEVFQSTRRIDRTRNAPGLVVFALREAVTLLDLRGTFATKMGASTAIHSGPRSRSGAGRTRTTAARAATDQPGEKGRALELHVRSSLRSFLPDEYGLTSRFVRRVPSGGHDKSVRATRCDHLRRAALRVSGACRAS